MVSSDIRPKEATLAATGLACLAANMALILISSLYIDDADGWPLFLQSVFSAATVCAVGASALLYAAHQQYVVKRSLFADHGRRRVTEINNNTAGRRESKCDKCKKGIDKKCTTGDWCSEGFSIENY